MNADHLNPSTLRFGVFVTADDVMPSTNHSINTSCD